MICHTPLPAGETLKVMNFDNFKKLCVARSNPDQKSVPAECRGCDTGKKIADGRLTSLPDNVKLIGMPAVAISKPPDVVMPEGEPEKIVRGPVFFYSHFKPEFFTLGSLKEQWINPVISTGSVGLCPCCGLAKKGFALGVCGSCFHTFKSLTGEKLLSAIEARASRPAPDVLQPAPMCACGKACEWYGEKGGYSVKCADCNEENAARQRAQRMQQRHPEVETQGVMESIKIDERNWYSEVIALITAEPSTYPAENVVIKIAQMNPRAVVLAVEELGRENGI